MNFDESVNYLLSLGNEVLAMKLGLENIRKVLKMLGNPQENYLKVQIAGTNGKGSTVAFLESICVSAGINVGTTTSPHLISITERIRINGQEISEKEFAKLATRVREISEKLVEIGELEAVPTYFEQVTAIALKAFAEAKIDLAILETGLGGRFDATTAANAEIVALTPIDFDHQNILGNTLKKIAAEKAAIIQENTQVVFVPQKKEAKAVILQRCRQVGVEPNFISFASQINKKLDDWGVFPFPVDVTLIVNKKEYSNLILKIPGKHQFENAALAIGICELLNKGKFEITTEIIKDGLKNAKHKGRLEFYKGILFDGAHNVSGAKVLGEYLDELANQPITMIFGAMRDKDLSEISEILFPKATCLIFTKADNPRSMEPDELIKFVPADFNQENIYLCETIEEALRSARYCAINGVICVTGSLYLVGEAQKVLQSEFEI